MCKNILKQVILLFLGYIGISLFGAAHAAVVPCGIVGSTQWIPSKGYAWISEDGIAASNSHYIYQYLYWRTPDRLAWFAADYDSTYEPDALFYNYNRNGTYGNYPLGYWASDLPSPYVDTQAFDGDDEKAVTIGSAQARLIQPGRFYYTVTRMTWIAGPGNVNTPVKLVSQRGRQIPSGCFSTNCSFGCNNNNNYRTVPFQSGYTAPGGRVWWWADPGTRNQPCKPGDACW